MFVHFISDGRDTKPRSFEKYFDDLSQFLKNNNCGSIATICGRYYAMDRNNNEDRINKAYNVMVGNATESKITVDTLSSDEMIEPTLLDKSDAIFVDDTVFFFNHRADRMRQIVKKVMKCNRVITLTEYDPKFNTIVIFKKIVANKTLSDIISENGLNQSHVAETEKYAHVTYFFNGGIEKKHLNENFILVPSPETADYIKTPGMSMELVTKAVINEMKLRKEFIVCNLAAPDMIGHTGSYKAVCSAVELTDCQIGEIYNAGKENEYTVIITADHGNCEKMLDRNGKKVTKHTTNKVPFILCDKDSEHRDGFGFTDSHFSLKDIAPTILQIMKIDKPEEMTGTSMIE